MTDDRKTIGSGGKPGRGNRATSPSAAARSLAGGAPARKPAAKAKNPSRPASTPTTPRKPAAASAAPTSGAPPKPRLRAVTDEDAA
ncbi:MAG: glycerol acyltransferase, partial [Aeromicrobium sp.]|nr:glycerol acyltransferase [Aeromicrobium sp.]